MISGLKYFFLIILLCLPQLFSACSNQPAATNAKIGQPAPTFALYDNHGKKWTLAEQKGKVVFVNFWATGCPPCRAEMPSMQKLYDRLDHSKFEMLTILYNDDPAIAQKFTEKFGYTFPVLLDYGGQIAASYGVTGVPETYIVDGEGILRESYIGAYAWGSAEAQQMFNKYIK